MRQAEDNGEVNANNQMGLDNQNRVIRPPGLQALHDLLRQIYPDQINPLTITTIVKYWLGGPDPLDYIYMYNNPGNRDLGVPPHWHYISMGLSDLHGDGRCHTRNEGRQSGHGFELTFRLVQKEGERSPPTWPANVMQTLAKYVFNSGNTLLPGDHVSWHASLDNQNGRLTQILMGRDPQFPDIVQTPHGDVSFAQIIGITSDELEAVQHWNGSGVINLLLKNKQCGPWLVTDMSRTQSIIEADPTVAQEIQIGIEREGSNLSGVSAKCWWVQLSDIKSETYRESRDDFDEEDIKPQIKSERASPTEQMEEQGENIIKHLSGIHITFNLEAGKLLPLVLRGRVLHGRHFTFKSIISHTAITFVTPSVTGSFVNEEKPYAVQGPWLQVLLPMELAERMIHELQVLSNPEQLALPVTFTWSEYNLMITVVSD